MLIRVRIDAAFDPTDTVSIDALRNGIIALQNKLKRVTAVETSTITVEKCRHDEGGMCEQIYSWSKE